MGIYVVIYIYIYIYIYMYTYIYIYREREKERERESERNERTMLLELTTLISDVVSSNRLREFSLQIQSRVDSSTLFCERVCEFIVE